MPSSAPLNLQLLMAFFYPRLLHRLLELLGVLLLLALIGGVDDSASGGVSDMITQMQCSNGRLMCVKLLPYLSIVNNNFFLKRLHQC